MTSGLKWFLELVLATFLGYMLWSYLDSVHLYASIAEILKDYSLVISVGGTDYFTPLWGFALFMAFSIVVYVLTKGAKAEWKDKQKEREELEEIVEKGVAKAIESTVVPAIALAIQNVLEEEERKHRETN